MSDLISLKEFRRQVESAELDEHGETLETSIRRLDPILFGDVGPIESPSARAAKEFDRMKEFLVRLYDGTTAQHSFIDPGGNTFDCIPFDQLPMVKAARVKGIDPQRKLSPPPVISERPESELNSMAVGPRPLGIVAPLRQGRVDQFGNKVAAPPGTAPLRRLTLAQLARLGSLDRHFKKSAPAGHPVGRGFRDGAPTVPVVVPDASGIIQERHLHSGYQFGPYDQGVIFSGACSYLNIWKPNPQPGAMSLTQQWILSNVTTSTGLPQTVEGGCQVCPSNYPYSMDPILFVFFNPDGYNPDNSGYVYNKHLEGFIPADGAHWIAGASLGQYSVLGGTQFGALMVWTLDDLGWNLYMGSSSSDLSAVGYFPKEYYGSGLANGANYVSFGGEVASERGSNATGPMGSGVMPPSAAIGNYGNVAFQYQIKYRTSEGSDAGFVDADLVTPGAALSMEEPEALPYYGSDGGKDPAWGSYFFFGGAGAP